MSRKLNENQFSRKFELLCAKTSSQEIHWSSSESDEPESTKHSRKMPLRLQTGKPTSNRKKSRQNRKSHLNNLEVSFTQNIIDRPKSPILTGCERIIDQNLIPLSPPPSPILKMHPLCNNYETLLPSEYNNSNSINIRSCQVKSPILKSKISPFRSICGTGFRKRLKLDTQNGKSKSMVNSDRTRPSAFAKAMICKDNTSDVLGTGFSYIDRNEGRTSPIIFTKLNTHNSHYSDRTLSIDETLSTNNLNLRKSPILKSKQKNEYKSTYVLKASNSRMKDEIVQGEKSILNQIRKSPTFKNQFQLLGKKNNENIVDSEDTVINPVYNKDAVLEPIPTSPVLNTSIILRTTTTQDSNTSERTSPILSTILRKSSNKAQHSSTKTNTSIEKIPPHSKSKEFTVQNNDSELRKYLTVDTKDKLVNNIRLGESSHNQLHKNVSKIGFIANDSQDTIPNSNGLPQQLAVFENPPKTRLNQINPKVNMIQKVKSFFDAQFSSQSASQNSIQETQSSNYQTSESTPVIDLEVSPDTKSDSDVIVLESDDENNSLVKEVVDLSSNRSLDNVKCRGRGMKKKYKKGGLAERLQNLVCKQNSAVSLWKHELFLAENTGFVVPANSFRLFRIKKCSFDFNITLLCCISLDTDENYFIVLNNLVTNNLVICENSMLKLFEPFFELDVRINKFKVIVNACKFHLIDVIKKESNL